MEHILTSCNKDASKHIICGDINVNMLNYNKCITYVLHVYDAKHIVISPSCYKWDTPTLRAIVITNTYINQ